jgi:hypothetical protein
MINLLSPAAEPEELVAWKRLAAAVIGNAVTDLSNPRHAVGAAAWLLEVEKTLWADWISVPRRFVRARVVEVAAAMITKGRANAWTSPASPRVRANLAAILRRHGLAGPLAPVVERVEVEEAPASTSRLSAS